MLSLVLTGFFASEDGKSEKIERFSIQRRGIAPGSETGSVAPSGNVAGTNVAAICAQYRYLVVSRWGRIHQAENKQICQ